jgi:hypothetical protein
MTAWTSEELNKIDSVEELQIQSVKRDGSLRRPVTIWVVRIGDDLYVRSVRGREGWWFRGTQVRHEGRIQAGGVKKDVSFEDEDDADINAQIDSAYRSKYGHYSADIFDPVLTPQARAATLKLVPR